MYIPLSVNEPPRSLDIWKNTLAWKAQTLTNREKNPDRDKAGRRLLLLINTVGVNISFLKKQIKWNRSKTSFLKNEILKGKFLFCCFKSKADLTTWHFKHVESGLCVWLSLQSQLRWMSFHEVLTRGSVLCPTVLHRLRRAGKSVSEFLRVLFSF